jgi:hypothetical protein
VPDAPAFEYQQFRTRSGPEWMTLRGPLDGPRVLILQPLLNEANQCRAMVVDLARRLAFVGIRTGIPDLPGTGESLRPLAEVRWPDWQAAAAAAAEALRLDGVPPAVASLRGGSLLDDACAARARWRFAETTGASLLRPLERAQRLTGGASGMTMNDTETLAGFRFDRELLGALRAAVPAPVAGPHRSLPFEGKGTPVWRKAEPSNDPALAEALANDIAGWLSR